jgi:hypothetical protein
MANVMSILIRNFMHEFIVILDGYFNFFQIVSLIFGRDVMKLSPELALL